jgi:hypothetical protein
MTIITVDRKVMPRAKESSDKNQLQLSLAPAGLQEDII